jgi:hypothetical protein
MRPHARPPDQARPWAAYPKLRAVGLKKIAEPANRYPNAYPVAVSGDSCPGKKPSKHLIFLDFSQKHSACRPLLPRYRTSLTADGADSLTTAELDDTGLAHDGVTAPRASAPAVAMTTAHFVICLFIVVSFRSLRAVSGGKSLVRHP